MNRIDLCFNRLRGEGRKAFIAYMIVGDPDFESSLQTAEVLAASGVDMLELGLPFSDPLADGPVIQAASQRALSGGFTMHRFWEFAEALRQRVDIPLCIMTYYNVILSSGLDRFVQSAAKAGIDALLVPDLPVEESGELDTLLIEHQLYGIRFVTPATPPERIQSIAGTAGGFLYCVSLTGVTGERQQLSDQLQDMLSRIRQFTDLPLCVGFGVSNAEQAKRVSAIADGFIIGSAIVRLNHELHQSRPADYEPLKQFVAGIRLAVDQKELDVEGMGK